MNVTQPLKIIPLGGLGEIGMNCMLLEYDDEILVVDCGLLFSDLDHFGVQFVIPDFTYLLQRKDKVKGFIITHGHEDHIGALPFALKAGIKAPIFATPFTTLMIRNRLTEYGLVDSVEFRELKMRETVAFKHFKVAAESVNHSIIDAAALMIDTPLGRIVHTGDFKMDPTPFYGSEIDRRAFGKAGQDGVLLLLSDSTNIERCDHSSSDRMVYNKFEQLFAAAEGLTMVAMFASNVGRMGQIFEIAKKIGKKVALAGRSMEQNARLAQELGYHKDAPGILISMEDLENHARKDVIVVTSGSQAELGSALWRAAQGEHRQIKLQKGDLILMSSRSIPGNERGIGRMINQLFKHGAEVLYEAVHDIHVSGHATRPELKEMIELTKPKFFIPIHGEYRHLVHHAELARQSGVKAENVLVAVNGDVIEVTPDSCRVVEHMEEPRVLIEGREGNDVSKLVLKDRRSLGEKGIVFSLMVRNAESRRIVSGPEIITRGLVSESLEGWIIEEARNVVKKIIAEYDRGIGNNAPKMDLQETIRIELRRFFNQNIGKKPTVLPIILDL